MGLFDKLLGKDEAISGDADAFTAIVLAVVASDGQITETEAVGLFQVFSRMKLYEGFSNDRMGSILRKNINLLKRKGLDALVDEAAKVLKPELRATAFAVASDLIFADGHVEKEEKDLMEKLQKVLSIEPVLAEKIVEVMVVKNRG
ncbi:MAG: tellurite resistance TerB family protein [Planctomycetes bacterium]|nr:tellurite resistance TerB family protein [Planctomycetota bacterium]